jgi:hypothetical protein
LRCPPRNRQPAADQAAGNAWDEEQPTLMGERQRLPGHRHYFRATAVAVPSTVLLLI